MVSLLSTLKNDALAAASAASGALRAGLGAVTSLGASRRTVDRVSFDAGRLVLLAMAVIGVAGCVALAARRYWYNKFWDPECKEVLLRVLQLENGSWQSGTGGDGGKRAFWDPVPPAAPPRVVRSDLEYVKMLIRLGYHSDAKRVLNSIEAASSLPS